MSENAPNALPKPHRRSRRSLPDLDLQEMYQSPSMKGMLSFLDISPEERLGMLQKRDAAVAATVSRSGMSSAQEVLPAVIGSVLTPSDQTTGSKLIGSKQEPATLSNVTPFPALVPLPVELAPIVTGSGLTPSDLIGSEEIPSELLGSDFDAFELTPTSGRQRAAIIKRCQLAQDAHTRSEQDVYNFLWHRHQAHKLDPGRDRLRMIQISDDEALSQMKAGNHVMVLNTYKASLKSLASKLALEVILPPPGMRAAKKIRLYSYGEILRRRNKAGLTHVRIITSKRELVLTPPGAILTPSVVNRIRTDRIRTDRVTSHRIKTDRTSFRPFG